MTAGNPFIQKCLEVVSRLATGRLTLVLPDGRHYSLVGPGDGRPDATVHVRRWRAIRKFLTQGDFGFVESYLDGDWDSPELAAVIELAVRNKHAVCVALHPGTVDTGLSKPFQACVAAEKLFTAGYSASAMLKVLNDATAERSGTLIAWDGQTIPF